MTSKHAAVDSRNSEGKRDATLDDLLSTIRYKDKATACNLLHPAQPPIFNQRDFELQQDLLLHTHVVVNIFMAIATMNHIIPKLHRSSQSKEEKRKESAAAVAREEEKRHLAEWEAEKEPLEFDQITQDPSNKPVGHSSKVLRCQDFELVKTLGTGTFSIIKLWYHVLVLVRQAGRADARSQAHSRVSG